MEADPTRMCELLVGLGDVDLVGIDDLGEDAPLEVVIRSRRPRPTCETCGSRCGLRAIGVWCWWTWLRSVGRFGCGGGSGAGRARALGVRSARLWNRIPRLVRSGRC